MKANQALAVVAELRATWPQRPIDDAQVVVWCETLSPVSVDAARAAVRRLRQEQDWLPSHHQFLTAAQIEGRRLAAHRHLDAGDAGPCPECGDDEWVTLGEHVPWSTPTVRPCSRCLPVQFVRWQGKHLQAGHRCGECSDLHGSAADKRSALAAIKDRHVPVDLDPLF